LTRQGHQCFVEHEAGIGAGFSDQDYEQAGARLVYAPDEAYGRADLALKFARPLQHELEWIPNNKAIAGFLYLASARQDRIDTLLKNKITSIAWELVQLPDGSRPVLGALSLIGGLMTAQIAASLLQNNDGGKGILLGGIPGVAPAEAVIIGAGIAGTNATRAFTGLGAHITVLDQSVEALQKIYERFPNIVTMFATPRNVERCCAYADVVVGAVMTPGERPPVIVTRQMVAGMKPRSVIIDLSIDQGGIFETSRPTRHDHPTYIEEGVIHYCVPNIPGVVARTSSHGFMNFALPFVTEIANLGVDEAIKRNPAIAGAVNTYNGELRNITRLESAGDKHDGLE
ncbi:MAG: alanine dehydrogenase, partial [Chloroflexi bacterium]|nr:alanine dehydrogenase [Chloroflexota bacterium]